MVTKKLFWTLCVLIHSFSVIGQDTANAKYEGAYGQKDTVKFHVLARGKTLFMDLPHYGKMELAPAGPDQFTMVHVSPKATLYFKGDTVVIHQIGAFTFLRDSVGTAALTEASGPAPGGTSFQNLTGRYRQDIDAYALIRVTASGGQLLLDGHPLTALGSRQFTSKDLANRIYEFVLDKKGQARKLIAHNEQPEIFVRMHDTKADTYAVMEHASNRKNGFTRADTLMGMLTPLRTCYDVLFYDLGVTLNPLAKTLKGKTLIRFKTLTPFDSLQVDLFANMVIDSIVYKGRPLNYNREFNAVYVNFPHRMDSGTVEEIQIAYHGAPRLPDLSALKGGFFWRQNKEGQPWVQSVVQGTGASLWWPCKDHNSDKADSMKISITVPRGLTDVSNGQFLGSAELAPGLTRWDWYVHYPINTYDVVLNVGTYESFTNYYVRGGDTIPLRFYFMPYDEAVARQLAEEVPGMLDVYTRDFGSFPFPRDGYGLVENIWSMEHQTAISIGYYSNAKGKPVALKDLLHTLWHESAHEWWGNSLTCRDYADFWIHESFATYAEVMRQETTDPAGALKYLKEGIPGNKVPVIGVYNVNNFHLDDVYTKGPLMLHTIRHCINNDSIWFAALRGIQQRYRHQTVTTEDIVGYLNKASGTDYTYLFDQYLRYTAIPVLALAFHSEGGRLKVDYKWEADVSGFHMPVQVTVAKDSMAFIYPTTSWQTMELRGMIPADFRVDTTDFYVGVRVQ
jgi:Peptidase family M1 domain/Peptidase M1 N-terminal domain